jgi:hypothetical protein
MKLKLSDLVTSLFVIETFEIFVICRELLSAAYKFRFSQKETPKSKNMLIILSIFIKKSYEINFYFLKISSNHQNGYKTHKNIKNNHKSIITKYVHQFHKYLSAQTKFQVQDLTALLYFINHIHIIMKNKA